MYDVLEKFCRDNGFSLSSGADHLGIFKSNVKIAEIREEEDRTCSAKIYAELDNVLSVKKATPSDLKRIILQSLEASYSAIKLGEDRRGTVIAAATRRSPLREVTLKGPIHQPDFRNDEEIYEILWNSTEAVEIKPNGSEGPHPNYMSRMPDREPGSGIGITEMVYGLRAIDLSKVPRSKVGFVSSFIESNVKNIHKYGQSARQEEISRELIAEYAPEHVAKKLGLIKKQKQETFTTFLVGICQKIRPYMASDGQWWIKFAESIQGRENLSPGQSNIALKFLSNYRDQLSAEDYETIYPHLPEQESFYKKFTIAYIKLMVAALVYGEKSGSILIDMKCREFLQTNGFGNPNTKHTVWKKTVEWVDDKIRKQVKKGNLEDFREYVENPDLYHSMIERELDGESTLSGKVDQITSRISDYKQIEYTDDQKEAGLACMRILDGMCDGAVTEDGHGFNKSHTRYGKHLADLDISQITNEDMNKISFMVKFYRAQLPQRYRDIVAGHTDVIAGQKNKPTHDTNTLYFRLLKSCII